MREFIGLRANLYSYKMSEDSAEHKKCKGVNKNVVKKRITHDDYKNCLYTGLEQLQKMNVIRSYLHNMYSEEVHKVALSDKDDKRFVFCI